MPLRHGLAVVVLLFPASSFAEEAVPQVSLTVSPIHLLLPVGEVTAEVRILDSLGAAGIVGLGSIALDVDDPDRPSRKERFFFWEVGGQARWYPIGDFDHGMEVGLQILYLGLSGDVEQDGVTYSGLANGVAIGPFLGYKLVTGAGFTFDAQLGVQWLGVFASAESSEGAEASEKGDEVLPILRLNVGWSL